MDLFITKNIFSTTDWNISPFLSLSCSTSYLTSNYYFVDGYETDVLTSYSNIVIHSLSWLTMSMCIALFFISVFIHRKVFLFPLTTDKYPICFFIYSMMHDITVGFLCDKLLSSTYQTMFYCLTSTIFSSTNLSYGFISKPIPLSVVENRLYQNNVDSMQP